MHLHGRLPEQRQRCLVPAVSRHLETPMQPQCSAPRRCAAGVALVLMLWRRRPFCPTTAFVMKRMQRYRRKKFQRPESKYLNLRVKSKMPQGEHVTSRFLGQSVEMPAPVSAQSSIRPPSPDEARLYRRYRTNNFTNGPGCIAEPAGFF